MPNKKFIIVVFIALFQGLGQGNFCWAQERYKIDVANSKIAFSIKHLGVLTVEGEFLEFSGSFLFEDYMLLSIRCKVSTASINTENNSRDDTLRDAAYLDVGDYPFITFYSEEITPASIIGRFKIKDVEQVIILPYEWVSSEHPGILIMSAELTIDRDDFELEFGAMDTLIGKEISLELAIAIYKD